MRLQRPYGIFARWRSKLMTEVRGIETKMQPFKEGQANLAAQVHTLDEKLDELLSALLPDRASST